MDDGSGQFSADGERGGRRRWIPRISAGLVVVLLLVALVVIVAVGVLLSGATNSDASDVATTVAELNRDPESWDDRAVVLEGTFEDVRTVPYLDQYALYTFRDDTGTIRVLSRNGAPAGDEGARIRLHAVYHSRVKLDDAIKALVEERLGGLAGSLVGSLLPGVPLDVVFLEHTSYEQL